MDSNAFARIWARRVIRGACKYADCPDEVKGYPVKIVVKKILIEQGYSDLVTN